MGRHQKKEKKKYLETLNQLYYVTKLFNQSEIYTALARPTSWWPFQSLFEVGGKWTLLFEPVLVFLSSHFLRSTDSLLSRRPEFHFPDFSILVDHGGVTWEGRVGCYRKWYRFWAEIWGYSTTCSLGLADPYNTPPSFSSRLKRRRKRALYHPDIVTHW